MNADQLRRAWTQFFVERQHTPVPASSLIPHHPTAPMFTNAGMNQFVPYFLGEEEPPFDPPRATSVQKSVRAGGKHNDLDAIGRSLRHLSFFEMLGNFSFGDYFKAEAIPWAWEFVTEVLGLDGDRIWVTVHTSDDEAEQIWRDSVGFPGERIQRLGKDNFWEMGETGPCGPSSELFWDFGPDMGPEGGPENPAAEQRYVEIWNLVFPQFFRQKNGELTDLARRGIDTGAGLERILGVLAGSPSLYAADTLSAMVDKAQELTGRRIGEDPQADIALRLLADHGRTMTFLVTDGVNPSNEERGYVLRRIIRRAVRFAYLLGVEQLVTPGLIDRTIEVMGDAYPELRAERDRVEGVITREEERFRQTLKTGVSLLDDALERLPSGAPLPGDVAFKLHDTYGFPLDVTKEVAAERDVEVDQAGFDMAMTEQRDRARAARKTGSLDESTTARYREILEASGTTDFTGRQEYESKGRVLAVVEGDDDTVEIFLDRTPFYAESGGQVGDTGRITTPTGTAEVVDTTNALPGLHRHVARMVEGEITEGQEATAAIDAERRDAIRRNHTATHLLHWALREVLGKDVKQQGSLVGPDYLRFDFSYHQAMTPEQVAAVEDLANAEVLHNDPVRHYETTKDEALAMGAIAFFGDKYGDVVRVLEAGRQSTELCGGTHVGATGDIGPIRITTESSIGANLRRIVATTGTGTLARMRQEEQLLASAAGLLGVAPDDVVEGVEKLRDELKGLRDELKVLRRQAAGAGAVELAANAIDGVVVARSDGGGRDDLKDLAVAVRQQPGIKAVVLIGEPETGGVALVAAVAKDGGFDAPTLIKEAATAVGGGGGGKGDIATAGGRDASKIDEALDLARVAAGLPTGTG
jgi:alanyl-tRNA synthetase